ncbi:MAG: hypothetical protein Q8O99_00375, partial [bacterium]|nr:hypothetical protein [bacterium]
TTTYLGLKDQLDAAFLALRDITAVDANLLIDLSTIAEHVQTERMIRINDTLVAFGKDDNRLYIIDKDTGAVTTQTHDSLSKLIAGNTPKENDMMAFVGEGNQIYVYKPDTKALSRTDISYPTESVSIAAPFIYNLRLYLIDTANNQILRHTKTQTGYDRGTPWLTQTTGVDLTGAVSLAIDGDIFVLKQTGDILKFSVGAPSTFVITGLDPLLDNPTDMYTYSDMESIFIVESTNTRIVELNKQGTFKAQYISDLWEKPTGMVVDTQDKTIYVLDGSKVYSFTI